MNQRDYLLREGTIRLLEVKDSDIRLLTLRQGDTAVDRGVHIGGANSATIPLVSLYYGGIINVDVEDPTRIGQDMFVLSKGHAVAAMASVYADLGYFDEALLENSRSVESLLNGHPGPLLPGVHIATGPLGQGFAVAQGFAMAGRSAPGFNVFCVTGDGELQEGVVWEAVMHAPARRLSNLCVLIDKNEGQLDDHTQLVFSMDKIPQQFEAFGWKVFDVDGTDYRAVLNALESFVTDERDGRPTAIVCNSRKGHGSFSSFLNKHKVSIAEDLYQQERTLQEERRTSRVEEYFAFEERIRAVGETDLIDVLRDTAKSIRLGVDAKKRQISPEPLRTRTERAKPRDKQIAYDRSKLPALDSSKSYAASDIIAECMKVMGRDRRVMSADADLGSTSGLQGGLGWVDQTRAFNVGIAESNMMCVGEAYAALGYNAWVSTFCPFFDWKVLRRIAVGQQERLEDIESSDGWLSAGHELDLTFLATAPNFETKTNGATHMGNDDTLVFSAIPGVKIIDVSCPNQLIGVMKWIMEGQRGLCYVRIMRSPSGVLYSTVPDFEFSKAYVVRGDESAAVHLISSGRGVHEALAAAEQLVTQGIEAEVVDMASIDEELIVSRLSDDALVVVAEQNNGYIWNEIAHLAARRGIALDHSKLLAINSRTASGDYQFIHSATYGQILQRFGLTPESIAERVVAAIK